MSGSADRKLIAQLLLLTAGTFAFGFALVPLYDVFCEITGLGGKTNATAANVVEAPDESREITIEFVTTVNEYAPWTFKPAVSKMTVMPGKLYNATFFATNLTDGSLVAQAVPSVAPMQAAVHFKKTECFCFTAQLFEATESKEMPVQFMVSRDLPEHVDTITLSYTLFRNDTVAANNP